MSSKARARAEVWIDPSLRPHGGIATGTAGRRDDRRISGIGGRRANFRIDTCGRTKHPVRLRQLVTQRFSGLRVGRAFRRDGAPRRDRLCRPAIGAGNWGWGCGLCLRRCWPWRRLCDRRAGRHHQHTREIQKALYRHAGKRTALAEVPQWNSWRFHDLR